MSLDTTSSQEQIDTICSKYYLKQYIPEGQTEGCQNRNIKGEQQKIIKKPKRGGKLYIQLKNSGNGNVAKPRSSKCE